MADLALARGACPVCGKETIIRNVRSKTPEYCSRLCASNARFTRRYTGTSASRYERPSMAKHAEWEAK